MLTAVCTGCPYAATSPPYGVNRPFHCSHAHPLVGISATDAFVCSVAVLGVNVVITPDPQVTHHLISTYTANSLIAASLVSACQFVKPEWLHEVIRLGNLPVNNDLSDGVSLERVFALPPINKYRPSFSPTLPTSQKVFKVWEPNEERLNMFQGYRYLCVGEKGREIDGDLREVISRAGGQIETFDAHSGKVKWHKALARGQAKEGKKLVVVGDKKSLQTAVGQGGWDELMSEAKGFVSVLVSLRLATD